VHSKATLTRTAVEHMVQESV